ncbi:MAG: gfo/Idh/MocA family oxidoreductase [Candidatus Omnitrophota bacterium]|nr:MAG: gfo/Idh/MocA family oxidoreductase [Candidatus Omnitrophota bacterium]
MYFVWNTNNLTPGGMTKMKSNQPHHKNKPSTRRTFLKTSTLAMSALAAADVTRNVYAAGDDAIKIGLIGCGGRGTGAAQDALEADKGVKLIALTDVFDDKVQNTRNHLRERKPDQVAVDDDHCFVGFDGYKKVIESGVDVVLIACASKFHPKYMKAALEAGKHVFVEKPHAIDPPGVRVVMESLEIARQKNLCLLSGLMNRHIPGVQETMKRVLDGAIGEIVAIEENFLRAPYVLVPRQPGDREIEYQFRNWYHFSWLSGDDVTQSLVHNLDKALWAMREKPPAKAHGLGGRSSMFGDIYGDVFDHHAVVYEYENGAKIYAFCRTQDNCHGGVSDFIMGTKGRCDLLQNRITGETNWQFEGPDRSGFRVEHENLMKSIRAGQPLISDYMARSTMIAVLGQMACYSGKQITWEEALHSDFTFQPPDGDFDTPPPKKPDADGNYPVAVPGKTIVI